MRQRNIYVHLCSVFIALFCDSVHDRRNYRSLDFASTFGRLLNAIQGVRCKLKAVTVRVTEVEDRIRTNHDNISSLQPQNADLIATMEKLVLKVYKFEICSRHSNLRLVSLPKRTEGVICALFWRSGWLTCLVQITFSGPPLIERARRIGKNNKSVTTHNEVSQFKKALVMKAARIKGPLSIDNQRIMLFPYVFADLLKRRKIFDTHGAAKNSVQGPQPWACG